MDTMTEDRIFKMRQNLLDAGCGAPFVERFLVLEQKRRRKEQYRLLAQHKAALLSKLHQEQRQIDSLDYLVYAMRKEDNDRNGGT